MRTERRLTQPECKNRTNLSSIQQKWDHGYALLVRRGYKVILPTTNMIMSGRLQIASNKSYHARLIDDNFWSKKSKIIMIVHNVSK
jgi:hypothetical protein